MPNDRLVLLAEGDVVETEHRRFHVHAGDLDTIARMRAHLVDAARARSTVTYGELVDELELPVPARRLGRLLVLLSEDCARRGEPTLAAIVVAKATGEVGHGYGDDAAADRDALYRHWSQERRP